MNSVHLTGDDPLSLLKFGTIWQINWGVRKRSKHQICTGENSEEKGDVLLGLMSCLILHRELSILTPSHRQHWTAPRRSHPPKNRKKKPSDCKQDPKREEQGRGWSEHAQIHPPPIFATKGGDRQRGPPSWRSHHEEAVKDAGPTPSVPSVPPILHSNFERW